jgi:hypothetical protein
MELIKWKLERIRGIWNSYFWEYKTLQKKINFNSEGKTNYFGDILGYFNDTFDLIHPNKTSEFQSNVFHYTGLLQIIYVQQDLTDELLYIFKIKESSRVDKDPNRMIRNQLIGHPISRSPKGDLESSVLFSNDTTNKNLQYLVYAKNNNFKMRVVNYDVDSIIDNHKLFLNKYFDIILNKASVILNEYKKRLEQFEKSISTEIKFEKIIKQTETSYEFLLKFNYLYKRQYLLACYNRQDEHPRYKFAVEIFLKELTKLLKESQKNISVFIYEKDQGPIKHRVKQERTVFINFKKVTVNPKKKIKPDYGYALGKLHGRSPVMDINFFRQSFPKNKKILTELDNMESNYYDDLEYYTSYEYLSKLILKNKYEL